ncbi:hypothetical protein L3X38_036793 [Prunus dulcis]|uniref:Uncharacterized protein n=1 Tax=Prunus dulcis TaxID=3755 RepID=A0AAD4V3Z5_PRUDU|nr:hypothetical protein L3X38_036793 [Prunus dulcis]
MVDLIPQKGYVGSLVPKKLDSVTKTQNSLHYLNSRRVNYFHLDPFTGNFLRDITSVRAKREDFFQRAKPYKDHPTILRMQKLAKELGVVIPVSFFEEANNVHYNSATRKSSASIQVTLDSVAVYLHTRGRSGDTGF